MPGGIEFDGREIVPFDREAVRRFLESLAGAAHGGGDHERVRAGLATATSWRRPRSCMKVLGDVNLSLSHEVGSIGLLERENATVLNAALVGVATRGRGRAVGGARGEHGLSPVTFFAQNDGTLMALEYALRYPVLTIGSGPANSIRGAAYLTGTDDALVIDVGGTSTDIGVLANGFPRESSYGVEIGGVRTNFRMPDLVTIALGGGTVVTGQDGQVRVGPTSVGYRLTEEALVFGGSTPTLTDAAVAAGRADLGERSATAGHEPLLESALAQADAMLADAVDRIKTARGDQPLDGGRRRERAGTGPDARRQPRSTDPSTTKWPTRSGRRSRSVSGQVDRDRASWPGRA